MKETLYLSNNNVAILNFDLKCPTSKYALLSSEDMAVFAKQYIKYLKKKDIDLYNWAVRGKSIDKAIENLSKLARETLVLTLQELGDNEYLQEEGRFLEFVEKMYDYWKSLQRYSITTNRVADMETSAFVNQDSSFNALVMNTFRTIEQTLQGKRNKVFRQQHSGTNAGIACYKPDVTSLSERYSFLNDILFIDSIMLRTPMILHPRSNKRKGMFEETDKNPAYTFEGDPSEYFCYPAKVGSLLIYICFHRDYMANGVSCANLFELATPEEASAKPDGIVLFGNNDGKNECTFYHDKDEDVLVGSVSSAELVEYFGYMKKMVLTIHNVIMIKRGWLPIHGAFINVTLHNGKSKGICLMGDSGAGKSETIEAMKALGDDKIKKIEVIFDDMGTFHIEDGNVYAQGTEIGAFVRLDDLDPGAPYRDMNRSIFFNPDQANSRVITPAAPYSSIVTSHKIDLFAYANNYEDKLGMNKFEDLEEAKATFIGGRRMAKGTTQEVGLSETFFANPFGPMQMQDVCNPIIDEVFDCLKANGTYIGEVYTHLGINPEGDDINTAAEALLDFIEK